MTGGERLRRIYIVIAGVLALGATVALAVVGIAPDGGHSWYHSIQTAMSSVADGISSKGGHSWYH